MTFWVAGAAVVGAGINAYSSNKASKAQQQSASEANALAKESKDAELALQEKMFNKNIELQQPAIDAGNTARSRLMQLLGLSAGGADNGSLMRDFNMADFAADPGYQFRIDQGQQALQRSAAARGGLLSGAAVKDAMRFGQGQGAQEWQAAFDRFKSNQASKTNPLLSLAGSGQVASGALGSAATGTANSGSAALGEYGAAVGQNLIGSGNARASGYVGAANGITGALGSVVNNYQQNRLFNLINQRGPTGSTGGSSEGASGFSGMYIPESSLPPLQAPALKNPELNFDL